MARLHTEILFDSEHLQVVATRWRRAEHPASTTAETPAAIIELLDRGHFILQRVRDRQCIDRNAIAFFNPGERFQVEHPLGAENAGIWLIAADTVWQCSPIETGLRPRDARLPFRRPCSVSTTATDLATRRLQRLLRQPPSVDTLGIEEALWNLFAETMHSHDGPPRGPVSTALARRVEAARAFLAENHRQPLRLADVAAAVGGSPYPLCRAFAACTGRSIHQHIISLRLRSALDEVQAGCTSLTALAMRCGFASHAHFTSTFRSVYGMPPSHLRRTLS